MEEGEDSRARFRLRSGRMEAFSDGVFAIAITLLVLEITVEVPAEPNLAVALLAEWPSYLAYVISFSTIGAVWLGHAHLTEHVSEVSQAFLRVNLLLLLFVGVLPFPTHLVAQHTGSAEDERVAVTIYGLVLLIVALCLSALWRV